MINKIKEVIFTLTEELKYNENLMQHCKGLEATLWGLEEQAKFPENSSNEDQEHLNFQINSLRIQVMNGKNLINSHNRKLESIIQNFSIGNCGGCKNS